MEQHPGRVSRHRDPDRQGQRLRVEAPGHVPHGRRDGVRRHVQAARPVVLGADGHVRRRAREDAVRHLVSRARSDGELPRGREAGVRHDTRRLDVHARPARAHLVPPGGGRRRLRRQRARRDQRQLLRPVRRRGDHEQARARRLLPRQSQRRSLEGGRAARNEQDARPRPPGDVQERHRYRRRHGDRRRRPLPQGMGGRGVDQRRRRLLRRQPQLLHLRHGREGVRLPAQRHRRQLQLAGDCSTRFRSTTTRSTGGSGARRRSRRRAQPGGR